MLTRRGFLIATASITGLSAAAGAGWLGAAFADSLTPGTRAPARAAPRGRSLDSSRLDPARIDDAGRALLVVDERFVDLQSSRIHTLAGHLGESDGARVVHIDGDAGVLWHRTLQPLIAPDADAPARRIASIDGWTSHADWFVLSTLAARYGIASRAVDGDTVAWHIDLALNAMGERAHAHDAPAPRL